MPSAANLLRLRNISRPRAALHDVSFDVAEGECLALLGPPSAGKSALLELVAGLAAPDGGDIALQDRDLRGVAPHRRGMGLVSAEANLFAHLTLAQNIALPLQGMAAAERARRVADMLDLLQLRDLASLCPPALPKLAAAQAALARALVGRPRLLLLDAPFAACDPATAAALAADLARLRAAFGFAVILATRDGAAARRADRIAILLDGRIAQEGTPRALYDRPVGAAVARCLGEVGVLPGRLTALEDDIAEVALDCGIVVEATVADAEPVGARCDVLIRPERVAVAVANAAELGAGAVPAIVREVRDTGDQVELLLAVGERRIVVRRPAAGLFAVGRPVAIAWQPQHAWACRPHADRATPANQDPANEQGAGALPQAGGRL